MLSVVCSLGVERGGVWGVCDAGPKEGCLAAAPREGKGMATGPQGKGKATKQPRCPPGRRAGQTEHFVCVVVSGFLRLGRKMGQEDPRTETQDPRTRVEDKKVLCKFICFIYVQQHFKKMSRKVKNHVKVYTSSFFAEVHVSKKYLIKVHIHVKMTTFAEEHLVE